MSASNKPDSIKKVLMEMVEKIRTENEKLDGEKIPTSDDIHKRVLGDMGETDDRLDYFLRMLKDAHYIFAFKIVEADPAHKVEAIEGYVIAEHGVINKLRERLNRDIESMFEAQFYARKSASACIKEVLGKGRQNNNTPLGKTVNAAVMLQQYENILKEHAEDYTETEKIGRLNDILKVTDGDGDIPGASGEKGDAAGSSRAASDESLPGLAMEEDASSGAQEMRAADSPQAKDIAEMDASGKWGQAVQTFGVQFLCRIHFRKNEFDKVVSLIRQKRIVKEDDLRFIRNTMRVLEERMSDNRELQAYRGKILELKRISQMKLNEVALQKK